MSKTRSEQAKSNVRTAKSHERRVRDLLKSWTNVEFRRRRVTGRDDATVMLESTGDVIAIGAQPRFNIEAKKGKSFSITALLGNPSTNIFSKWYFQSSYDAKIASERTGTKIYPMLFFKPNVNEDWIAVSIDGLMTLVPRSRGTFEFAHLRYDYYSYIGEVECDVSHSSKKPKFERMQLQPCILCRWKDFADHFNPESFFQCVAAAPTQ